MGARAGDRDPTRDRPGDDAAPVTRRELVPAAVVDGGPDVRGDSGAGQRMVGTEVDLGLQSGAAVGGRK